MYQLKHYLCQWILNEILMATYNFELNSKPSKKGTFVVLLRITENKRHKRIRTNVELDAVKYWNPNKQEVRKSEPNYKVLNEALKKIKDEAMSAEEKLLDYDKGVTSQNVVATMKAGRRVFSFIEFVEDYAQRTMEAGEYRTYTKYITFLNKLKFFINGVKPDEVASIPAKGKEHDELFERMKKDLLFSEITLSFLNKFKTYLKKIPNTKNPELTLHMNTISKLFDNFKSLYHKGLIELREEGLSVAVNPFEDFECETIDTNKEKLTWDEIEDLKALELEDDSLLWHTRNCFLLAFYCAGMRAGDLIQLRGTNVVCENGQWRIQYRMDKTSTMKDILLLPEALEIIESYISLDKRTDSYIFPLLDNGAPYASASTWEAKEQLPYELKKMLLQQVNSKNSLLNKYLKKLADMAGIEKKVSMHIARHSFANIARQKNANVYDISKSLGHSSLKITETYLSKFDTKSQDATMKKVFSEDKPSVDEAALLSQLGSLNPEQLKSLLAKLGR